MLGGWVSSNYAASGLLRFSSCDGTYSPSMDLQQGFNIFKAWAQLPGRHHDNEARTAIHWVHRIGAIIVLFVVGGLVLQVVRRVAIVAMRCLLAALVAQITLGILNVVWCSRYLMPRRTTPLAHSCCWYWLR